MIGVVDPMLGPGNNSRLPVQSRRDFATEQKRRRDLND